MFHDFQKLLQQIQREESLFNPPVMHFNCLEHKFYQSVLFKAASEHYQTLLTCLKIYYAHKSCIKCLPSLASCN